MSAVLTARSLSAGHGGRPLFADLDLVVAPGDVVGLVGVNGAGKSTLLRQLAGVQPPATGSVHLSPPQAAIGYLPQETQRQPDEDVAGLLARRTGVASAAAELERSTADLVAAAEHAEDRYAVALERWLALGGADLEERSHDVLHRLELSVPLDAPMAALSGGQVARIGLAALLLSRYDVFLLDEPTNDLDLESLERLEQFVHDLRAPVVLVSHDREFLARTVTAVLELDLAQQHVCYYDGGYESYVQERAVARGHARQEYEQYARTRDALQQRARMQRAWMSKGVRNARRKAPDHDKIAANQRGQTSEKQAAKAAQTERMLQRLPQVAEPRKEWRLQLSLAPAPPSGVVVAQARGVLVRRGPFTLGPVDLQITRGDRVAVIGPNGAGKSTLLALLTGRLAPDEGQLVTGSALQIGAIDQARDLWRGEQPLARTFAELLPDWNDADVRTLLAKFGLGSAHVNRATHGLSPGERTRAALALLQARPTNLLVLDEPTNHLDLPAVEQLEEALEPFTGTLLLVTHDRRLLHRVRLTRVLQVVPDDPASSRVVELNPPA